MPHAIRIHAHGGPEVLKWEEAAVGDPGPGELRLRQEAAGVNFIDIYQRTGLYKLSLPAVLGNEGAGIVEEVGPGVTDFRKGDRVAYATATGGYAETRLIAADACVPVPGWCAGDIAASSLLRGMTAHYLIHDTFRLQHGHTILLHAAAGGVGQIMTQWAKARGAIVIATVGSEAKAAKAAALGAAHVIDYAREDFVPRVQEITQGKGVDVVYDSVGKATFLKSLDCLKMRGLMISFGQASGAVDPIVPGLLGAKGGLYLTRPSLGHYTATKEELRARAAAFFAAIHDGTLKVEVNRRFALKDAAEAHKVLEARDTMGAVALVC